MPDSWALADAADEIVCAMKKPCLYKTRAFYPLALKYQHDSGGA